ncbi:ATP-binding protein [Psychromonas sp. KJ10-10]|uniref:hybrid sensor histidine kinase/response regulator transcription factor n=1 Tax=Psychromonas sp. KJ10-10 TaxID=3391823 RepID=UPI0039B6CFDE
MNATKNEYQYQLKGYDDHWIQVPASNKEIKYSSLPRGKYVLNIKAKASNGLSNSENISVAITVRPELWKTWWAYAIYMVALFFLIYALLQLRTKELRNRSEHLKRLIKAKTVELQQKNSHLGNKTYELETLLKNQDDFYLKVAHELRTPLTLIQIPAELLLTENLSEQGKTNLNIIFNATTRMKNLTDQMFLVARAGKVQQPGVVTFDLNAHILSITYIYQLVAQEKNIEYIVKPIPATSVTIKQQVLESTLHNLLSNAIRYTDVGGQVIIEVTLCGNWLQLLVKDNGIGISEADQRTIFERFNRTQRAQEFVSEGDGIGLYTVMQDLNNCGGAINVDSEEGKGSVFTVCIPCQFTIDPTESVGEESPIVKNSPIVDEKSSQTTASVVDKPTILIIEEDIEIRHLLSTLLNVDYQVTSTGSANKGQALALQMDVDLVLCDVLLPDGNGYEITHTLKNNANTAHIPIILLSTVADIAGHQEGWDNGADDYIVKPFSTDDLLQRVSALITNRQRIKKCYLNHIQDK